MDRMGYINMMKAIAKEVVGEVTYTQCEVEPVQKWVGFSMEKIKKNYADKSLIYCR